MLECHDSNPPHRDRNPSDGGLPGSRVQMNPNEHVQTPTQR